MLHIDPNPPAVLPGVSSVAQMLAYVLSVVGMEEGLSQGDRTSNENGRAHDVLVKTAEKKLPWPDKCHNFVQVTSDSKGLTTEALPPILAQPLLTRQGASRSDPAISLAAMPWPCSLSGHA